MKNKVEEINKKIHEISTKMYEDAMKQEKEAKDGEVGKDKDAIDAEIIDDDDKK